jgi:hypothetical protein
LHASAPLQAFESEQLVPAAAGVCVMPDVGLQASTVHGFASSNEGGWLG